MRSDKLGENGVKEAEVKGKMRQKIAKLKKKKEKKIKREEREKNIEVSLLKKTYIIKAISHSLSRFSVYEAKN